MRHEAASIIVNSRFNPPKKPIPLMALPLSRRPRGRERAAPQVHEPKAARSVPSQHNSISFNCVLKQIQPFHNFADVVHHRIRLRLAEEDDRTQGRGTSSRCRPPRLSATNSHQPAPAGHQNRPLRPKGLPQPRKRARAFTRADGLPHVGEWVHMHAWACSLGARRTKRRKAARWGGIGSSLKRKLETLIKRKNSGKRKC